MYQNTIHKEEVEMKRALIALLAAGLIGGATIASDDAFAGNGRGGGSKGTGICKQTSSTEQTGARQRLRDGSCINANKTITANQAKKGNTYGPGDGTGNDGVGPKDGSGYGTAGKK
jgi:hypothetical protein